jgi:hypothetical protein
MKMTLIHRNHGQSDSPLAGSIDTIMLSIYNSLVHGISPEQLGHKKIEREIENWEMT